MTCVLCPVYRRPGLPREAVIGVSCEQCLSMLQADLLDIDVLSQHLEEALTPVKKAGGGGPRKPASRPPVSIAALSMRASSNRHGNDALPPEFLLREWATVWAFLRGVGWGEREYVLTVDSKVYVPVVGITGLSLWLRDRVEWAAEYLGEFPRFAKEVRRCVEALIPVTGELAGGLARQIGWCPTQVNSDGVLCMAPLMATTWAEEITCNTCNTTYPRAGGGWGRLAEKMRERGLAGRF